MFERFGIIKKNSGFTVLELIIALTIFGIVSYVLFEFVFMHFFAINDETTKAQLNQEVRVALEKIVDEMRRAAPADPHETGIRLIRSGKKTNQSGADIVNTTDTAEILVIRLKNLQPPYNYYEVCYRIKDNALIRYNLDDSDFGELTGTTKIYPVIASKGKLKVVKNFKVKYEKYDPADNYLKYKIELTVAAGPDATTTEGTKITVSQDATVIKNKTPVP